ncbi:MAG: hypothetical protein QOE39_2016 [Bradyrhizobium sp.]|jgi:hypothetical protein|nr:hypothetical protein [Bradyrhizobium sp.]
MDCFVASLLAMTVFKASAADQIALAAMLTIKATSAVL